MKQPTTNSATSGSATTSKPNSGLDSSPCLTQPLIQSLTPAENSHELVENPQKQKNLLRSVKIPGYQVDLARGIIEKITDYIPAEAQKIVLVYPGEPTHPLAPKIIQLKTILTQAGLEILSIPCPDAEAAKNAEVLVQAWEKCGEARIGRRDCLVALGGGASTDLGGFIAATWLRGISLINVPTTLLAMVDAAIGGKTGINTSWGKNLVGSFYPPQAVLCDFDFLQTLPEADFRSGMAEAVKCGFIADLEILRIIRENTTEVLFDPASEALAEIITRAVEVKAKVVSEDLRESGLREILNYGHTLGHAIEKQEQYTWKHGDAVSIGMMYAAALADQNQISSGKLYQEQKYYLDKLKMPQDYLSGQWQQLYQIMLSDKKVRSGEIRMVLLEDFAKPVVRKLSELKEVEEIFNQVIRKNGA